MCFEFTCPVVAVMDRVPHGERLSQEEGQKSPVHTRGDRTVTAINRKSVTTESSYPRDPVLLQRGVTAPGKKEPPTGKGRCKRSSSLVLVNVRGWLHFIMSNEIIRTGKGRWMELIRCPAHA